MANYKYRDIVDWAEKYIEESGLRQGDKFLSEAELSQIHGVSRQTVRQALEVLARKNVIVKKRGSGTYVQKTSLKSDREIPVVGVVITFFKNYIFPEIITGIENQLTKNNYAMQICTTHNSVSEEARALESMLLQNVDGVIVEPSKSGLPNSNESLYKKIRERGIPLIFFNAKYPLIDFPVVSMDNVEVGRVATEYLISLGHRNISVFLDFEDYQGQQRYKGYTDSLIAHRIPFDEKRVLWFPFKEWEYFFTTTRERILTLLSTTTAVVCYNDMLAVMLVDFCKREGIRIPEDLSIVGIDDSNLATICEVQLTSVSHAKQKLGEKSAELLLNMIKNGNSDSEDYLFRPKIIVRQSTAPPKK